MTPEEIEAMRAELAEANQKIESLANSKNTILDEKKKLEKSFKENQERIDAIEREKLEADENFKELSKKDREEKLQTDKELKDLKTKIANQKRDAMVKDLALGMTTDKDEIDVISRFATDYTEVDGDEVKFSKSLDEVKAELSRFVKSKASGGNDGGNNNTGGDSKPKTFKEKQAALLQKK